MIPFYEDPHDMKPFPSQAEIVFEPSGVILQ